MNTTKPSVLPASALTQGMAVMLSTQYDLPPGQPHPGLYRSRSGSFWQLRPGAAQARRVTMRGAMQFLARMAKSTDDQQMDPAAQSAFLADVARALPS